MRFSPHIAALLLATGARGTPRAPERWQLRIVGPATEEQGELRIDGTTARILVESDDTAFQVLSTFRLNTTVITFTIPHDRRRFEGTLSSAAMQGVVHNPDGSTSRWDASRMPSNANYWPVRPRVTVRQLELGSNDTVEKIPGAWVAAMVDTSTLGREYRQIALLADIPAASGATLAERSRRVALGLDEPTRAAARRVMEAIFAKYNQEAAAAMLFHRADIPGVVLDAHDYVAPRTALASARAEVVARLAGLLAPGDSSAVREAEWRMLERTRQDSSWARAVLDTVHEHDSTWNYDALRWVFGRYRTAEEWWPDAVRWLMTHRWIDTPQGARSPAQLVAAFWGVDSLPLPVITPEMFGDFAALPVFGAARLGERFVVPKNASAREWLAQGGGVGAIDTWRDIAFGWPEPLPLVAGNRTMVVTSPSGLNKTHGGAYLAGADAIKIEPGIVPLLAVVTVIHEWQHLILSAKRAERSAGGMVSTGSQLQIREDDPWLAEGAAEWITEQILMQTRKSAPLLAMFDAEKRYAIGQSTPDDPHALGYRLIRAVAKGKPITSVRDWLVRYLGDPAALARVAGLGTTSKVPPLVLRRPATALVIPEVTFIWDDGFADQITHRLIIPTRPLEH